MIGAVIDLVMLEGKKKDATQRCQDTAAAPPMDAMEPNAVQMAKAELEH